MKKDPITIFPIWEKVYLDQKDISFFEYIKGIQIKNKLYIFPSSLEKNPINTKYFMLRLDTETLSQEEMGYACFNPVFDNNNIIYLFKYEDSFSSDYRYSIVEFNIEINEWRQLPSSGTSPKRRTDDFYAFYLNDKIYFFGGFQIFPGDNTGSFIYSFCTINYEWSLVNYVGNFPATTPLSPYLGNRGGINGVTYYNKNLFFLGGKVIENNFPDVTHFSRLNFNYVETNDFYEFEVKNFKWTKKNIKNNVENVKFYNHSTYMFQDFMIIFNKGNIYCFDFFNEGELSMKKPLLFTPENKNQTILCSYNNYLYLIGRMKDYDDCIIYKTHMQNFEKKSQFIKEVGYESLFNNKQYSDLILSVERREILINKKVLMNMNNNLKQTILTRVSGDNVVLQDVSYVGAFNLLKIIYSNFTENIAAIDFEILNEIFNFMFSYKTTALINKIVSLIKINNNNAFSMYELALRYNLNELKSITHNYISENLYDNMLNTNSLSQGLKKLIYENYFCPHKLIITSKSFAFDIKNVNSVSLTNEKLQELKEICKETSINFCLNCRKIVCMNGNTSCNSAI